MVQMCVLLHVTFIKTYECKHRNEYWAKCSYVASRIRKPEIWSYTIAILLNLYLFPSISLWQNTISFVISSYHPCVLPLPLRSTHTYQPLAYTLLRLKIRKYVVRNSNGSRWVHWIQNAQVHFGWPLSFKHSHSKAFFSIFIAIKNVSW